MDAVDVHVGEPGLGVEAAGPHLVVAATDRREVEVTEPGGGGQADRPDALPLVERPEVAFVATHERRRPILELRRHPPNPGVGWFVDVRVAVEDRIGDRRVVVEQIIARSHGITLAESRPAHN